MPVESSLTPSAPPLAKARTAQSTFAVTLVAAGLLLLGFVVRVLLTRRIPAPWIMGDELLYSDLARSFADDRQIAIRGVSVGASTYGIYPVVISPAWLFDSTTTAYGVAKAINALLMTLAAVPMYLWARRLVRAEYALCLLSLVLLLPAGSYAGTLMTENVGFPAACLALFATAVALERATLTWQLVALAAVLFAVGARLQNVIFLVIVPTAVVLKVLLDARAAGTGRSRGEVVRGLRSYAPTWLALSGLLVAYALYQVARDRPLSGGLGVYRTVASTEYSVRAVGRWAVFHFAEIGFAVAIVPVAALIIMFGLGCSRRFATTAAERAFLAIAAASLWFVLEAGAFASHFIQRIEERNMIYAEPVFLLALVLWLERGAPRPSRLTTAALLVPSGLLLALPLERFFNVSIFSDTPALIPLLRVSNLVSGGTDGMRVLLAVGVLGTCLFGAFAPTRVLTIGSLVGVAVFLGVSTHMIVGSQRGQALAARAETGAPDVQWVDRAVPSGKSAGLLFTPEFSADGHPLWQTEFWNRDIDRVYYFGARDFGGFPGFDVVAATSGRLVSTGAATPTRVDYMVTSPSVELAGSRVAAAGRFVLYRVSGPLRLAASRDGLYSDGWTGPDAAYTRYVPGARAVSVDLSRVGWTGQDVPSAVRVELVKLDPSGKDADGEVVALRTWMAHARRARSFRFPAPRAPFAVRVHVSPTFSPAQFGLADTRQLGVQAAFRISPR